jgi:hypothetical protein
MCESKHKIADASSELHGRPRIWDKPTNFGKSCDILLTNEHVFVIIRLEQTFGSHVRGDKTHGNT